LIKLLSSCGPTDFLSLDRACRIKGSIQTAWPSIINSAIHLVQEQLLKLLPSIVSADQQSSSSSSASESIDEGTHCFGLKSENYLSSACTHVLLTGIRDIASTAPNALTAERVSSIIGPSHPVNTIPWLEKMLSTQSEVDVLLRRLLALVESRNSPPRIGVNVFHSKAHDRLFVLTFLLYFIHASFIDF
jgi:hypothetical protein